MSDECSRILRAWVGKRHQHTYQLNGDKMIILFLIACLTEKTPEQKEASRIQLKCMSKSSGSQPECWDEDDWKAYCERVACKKQ